MTILAGIFFIGFFILAWSNFKLALGFFIVILPAYLIRLVIFGLPSTVLEVAFWALALVWFIKYFKIDKNTVGQFFQEHRFFTFCFVVFFLASVAGVFVSDMWWYSLGQWRAYFLEPMILFIIILGRRTEIGRRDIIFFLAVSSLSISVLAIWQTFVGSGFPPALWDDTLNGRAVSFFSTPNAIGLYLAPVFFLPIIFIKDKYKKWLALSAMVLVIMAIIFSRSIGAGLALAAGGVVLMWLFVGLRKAIAGLIIVVVIITVMFPGLIGILQHSKSAENRLLLWGYAKEFLTANPRNFVLGAGIRQFFRKVQKPYYDVKKLERLIYPHNVLLNFWTEIGLLGMLSFVGLFVWALREAWQKIKQNRLFGSVLLASLVVFFTHGLVDVPYFKNDLAFLFWIIFSLIIA